MAASNDKMGMIIKAFRQGDTKAFEYIFYSHYRPLCYFAENLLGLRQEAEDIVTEKLIKLWEKHADFESLSSIKAFLYISVHNACRDFLKSTKRVSASKEEILYLSNPHENEILYLMLEAELLGELVKEIERLPKSCRRVFELSFFNHLNSNEIAEQLGLSVKTVRNQKARAVQLIKTGFLKRNLLFSALIFSAYANNLFAFTEANSSSEAFAEKKIHFFSPYSDQVSTGSF